MKKINLVISMVALVGAMSGARAIKLCQLDWFKAWQNKSGALSNTQKVIISHYGSHSEGGVWTVTSDQGSPGVQHTVSGMSQCTDDIGTTTTEENPWPSSTLADNTNCWCRMTSPNVGASWVFTGVYSLSHCSYYCAFLCAHCIQFDTGTSSCTRSALLALPQ
ncbi:MAG: hypothetical protein LBL21_04385 [Rickettsiales bacterium]|jgi:hypothetical protein|nr:hypothetical protein [Rickettsiales bacterium]